jgi:transcriptional regulator GlxA family with amidase domain
MIIFPTFQALDVFGPLDVLNSISSKFTLNLSIIASTLDPVSTAPRVANALNSTFSESIVPTHTFAAPPPDLDVLMVLDGLGTRAPDLLEAIAYIKDVYPSLQYIISVCTGATLLARAGVLDGRKATTNKWAWAWATSQGPNVTWIPHARWVVDGNAWTTSGVSAGIDGVLAFVSDVYGEGTTNSTSIALEYERHTDPSWDLFSAICNLTGTA